MFGQSNNNNPFGGTGGGFGQQNTAPAFGSPQTAAPSGGLFGAPAPAPFGGSTFGAPAPSATPFGASAPAGGLFGQPAPAPAFGGFGAPAPAGGGGGGGIFGGQPAPAPAFGASASGGGMFGQTSNTNTQGTMFGSSTTSGFGSQPNNTFGGAPAPAYGAPAGGSLFGNPPAPSTGLFGATPAPAPFASSAPSFGGGSTTFGSPAPAPFGASAPAPGGMFGSPAPAPGMFGTPATGAPGGGGSRSTPFSVTPKQDGSASIHFQSISAMPTYEQKSFEELRFEDYSQGNRGQASSTPTSSNTGSFFGAAPAPSSGLFGSGQAPARSGGLFGSSPAPAPSSFGAPPGGGLFGSPAPAPSFGGFGSNQQPASSSFGASASTFGAPAPATGSLFGAPAPSAGFGSGSGFGAPQPPPTPAFGPTGTFGAPAAGGLFGAPAPSSGFGSNFGGSAPAPAYGAPGFGAPAPAGGNMFGPPSPAPGFGNAFGTQSSSGGLFGQTPASGGGLFGAQSNAAQFGAPQPTGFGYPTQAGQPQVTQQSPGPAANSNIVPPAMNELFKQRISALEKMKSEFEQARAWQPDNSGPSTTTTSLASPSASFTAPPPPYAISSASMLASSSSPPSATQLRPRGFPRRHGESTPTAKLSDLGRGSAVSGQSQMRSPVMQLVVKPNSIGKPRLRLTPGPTETITPPPKDPEDSPGTQTRFESGPSLTPLAASHANTPTAQSVTTPQALSQAPVSPKPSPAAEALYREAIADEAEPPTTPVSRQVESASHLAPKLTKEGYETSPPIEELSKMSEADLATVKDFVVRRRGFGEVAWEGAVDVRGVDLDRAVSIELRDVSVYSIEEQEQTKPKVGHKLNRPATIAYEEVYPRDDPQASKAEVDKFAARLEKRCQRMGAEFVEYDRSTGTWKIRVAHFSRYALIDDDSEDEGTAEESTGKTGGVSFTGVDTLKEPKSLLRRKQTPHAEASRVRFDMSMESTDSFPGKDVVMSDAAIMESVNTQAAEAFAEVFSLVEEKKSSMTTDEHTASTSIAKIIEEDVVEDEATTLFVPPDESVFNEAIERSSIIHKLLSKRQSVTRSNVNFGLRSGQVSRVGWHPTGHFLSSHSKVFLEPRRPDFGTTNLVPLDLLRLLLSKCTKNMQYSYCPLLQMPQSLQNGGDHKSHAALLDFLESAGRAPLDNIEMQKTFSLLAALLETPENTSAMVVAGDERQATYTFNDRTGEALLRWLVEVNAAEVKAETGAALQRNDVAGAIFAAVSGGDLHTATKVAADAGLLDLAIALSTGTEGRISLGSMIARVVEKGELRIPQSFLRSLRAVSGDSTLEESLFRSGSKLSWQKRFALKLIQYPTMDLQSLVSSYDNDVKNGTAPVPSPMHQGTTRRPESIQYKMLRAIADPKRYQISEVVDTNGFSSNSHDLILSFLLAISLAAAGFANSDALTMEFLSNGFEAQLLSGIAGTESRWDLAVAVALCSSGSASATTSLAKMKRAHDYVLKFHDNSESSRACHEFLEKDVGLPAAWFAEALAYKSAKVLDFVGHMHNATPEEATEALERHWLPSVYFMNKPETKSLLSSIEDIVEDSPDSLVAGAYRLQKLEVEVQRLSSESAEGVAHALPGLLNECKELGGMFEEAMTGKFSQGDTFPFPVDSRVESKHMLREALSQIAKLHFQLVSLSGVDTSD